jgi:hypothetical protein
VQLQVCDVPAGVPADIPADSPTDTPTDAPIDTPAPDVPPESSVPDSTQLVESGNLNDLLEIEKLKTSVELKDLALGEAGWIRRDRYQASIGSDLLPNSDSLLKDACNNSSASDNVAEPSGADAPLGTTPNAGPEAPGQNGSLPPPSQ